MALAVGAWLLRPARQPEAAPAQQSPAPLRLATRVLATYPHDPGAYTQGLVWWRGGLYESTGRYGASRLRRVRLESGEPELEAALAPEQFGEGLAAVGERLVQLTWREGLALVWEAATLRPLQSLSYRGEGWGLCFDGRQLFMSDGSAALTLRDPRDFRELGRLAVRLEGRPVARLNELECAEGFVYANVYQTESIVRIDPASGEVLAIVDASGLLAPEERAGADVLNGIAYLPERGSFLLTGKLWPRLFEVVFVEREAGR